jgi:sugar phosphate isomerase/epimerase/HEAT repeat protein
MSRLLSRLVLVSIALATFSLHAQPERPGVAEEIARLRKASVAEIVTACDGIIVPEKRVEADDTKDRMVLYGLVMQTGNDDALRNRVEAAFCKVLATDKPTAIKTFFLDQLRPVASPACVPTVAALLPDPALCDLSARVLVSVGNDQARLALRSALPTATGAVQLAVVQALGELTDTASVPELLTLAKSGDEALRVVVRKALAATGDARAVDALLAATQTEKTVYAKAKADESYLLLLRRLAANGSEDRALELALAFAQARAKDAHIQCGTIDFCGELRQPKAIEFVVSGLTSDVPRVRIAAGRALRALPAVTVTPRLMELLGKASADQQVSILQTLGDMKATGALAAVKARLASPEASVRQAAIGTLAKIAGKDAVADLVPLLVGQDAAAARAALCGIEADGTGDLLVAQAKSGKPDVAAAILSVLAERLDEQAPAVLAFAANPDADVRLAALQALAVLGQPAQTEGIAQCVVNADSSKERKAAAKALVAICRRTTDPTLTGPAVLAVLQTAQGDARQSLISALPAIGDAKALACAKTELGSEDAGVKRAAVEALAAWPDSSALPALLEVVANDQDIPRYVLAFRGVVRLIGTLAEPTDALIARYEAAMKLARRPDEKRLALAGLGSIRDRSVLPKLATYFDDPQLADDAAVAAIELSKTVRGEDAIVSLRQVLAKVKTENVQKQAKEALSEIAKFAGCVGMWEVAGPYTKDNMGHTAIYPVVFPPEQRDAKDVEWRRAKADRPDGHLNLIPLCGESNRCAYMRVNIIVQETCQAQLNIGSDDGLKVWLNGNVCHEMNVPRGYIPFEDTIPVVLLKGTNTLMMKITQGGGGWEANARVRDADGLPLAGLNFELGEPVYREPVAVKLADGAPTAEELGWRMSIQCWSFRNFTFFESVDKAKRMGVRYLEMFPGQTVDKQFGDAKTNQDMAPDVQKAIQDKLAAAGIKVVNFGVTGIPGDEAGRRKLFSWAKTMGIETICSEPDPKDLPGLDVFCKEYGINIALHNHPTPSRYWNPQTVLDACKGLSPHIGACADTGHWMRSDIKPIEAVKLLKGRIVTFHFKDLNKYGKDGAHDVPWGTGEGNVIEVLRELKRQGVKAAFSSEYEHNWDNSEVDIAACVRNFEAMARQIKLEEDGKWQVIFNMRDLDSFQNARGDAPGAGWKIQGADLAMPTKGGGDIWTRERFADFELDLEFNTTGNSGLFFRTDNPRDPVQTGIEMQVERPGGPGKHTVGAFYDLQAPTKNAAVDGWNHVTLTAKDNMLTVVMNGQKINELDLNAWSTPGQNPDGSKNKFTKALKDYKRDGHIGFQDHGNPVRYRNIRIRRL